MHAGLPCFTNSRCNASQTLHTSIFNRNTIQITRKKALDKLVNVYSHAPLAGCNGMVDSHWCRSRLVTILKRSLCRHFGKLSKEYSLGLYRFAYTIRSLLWRGGNNILTKPSYKQNAQVVLPPQIYKTVNCGLWDTFREIDTPKT